MRVSPYFKHKVRIWSEKLCLQGRLGSDDITEFMKVAAIEKIEREERLELDRKKKA